MSDGNSAACSGLSLKARESASLAMKRIFEQINGAGAGAGAAAAAPVLPPPAPSDHLHDNHHRPSSVQVNADLQLERGSLVKVSSSCWGENESPPHQGIIMQPKATTRLSTTTPFNKSQLTIFYSGMVNVYDDVPADKAQAIMLLAAGSENSPLMSNNLMADYNVKPASFNSKVSLSAKNSGYTESSPPPSPNIINIADDKQIKRSHIELPYARKASFARFLGQRKERVQAKAGVIRLSAGQIDERPPSPNKRPSL